MCTEGGGGDNVAISPLHVGESSSYTCAILLQDDDGVLLHNFRLCFDPQFGILLFKSSLASFCVFLKKKSTLDFIIAAFLCDDLATIMWNV